MPPGHPFFTVIIGQNLQRSLLQEFSIKRPRKQIFHLNGLGFAVQVGENYRNIAAEFPDYLTADAAGGR